MYLKEFINNLKLKSTKITLCLSEDATREFNGTVGELNHWVGLDKYGNYLIHNIYTDTNHFIVFLDGVE